MLNQHFTFSKENAKNYSSNVLLGVITSFSKEIGMILNEKCVSLYDLKELRNFVKKSIKYSRDTQEEMYNGVLSSQGFTEERDSWILTIETPEIYSQLFHDIILNEMSTESKMTELFLQKYNFSRNDLVSTQEWFEHLSTDEKIIIVIALYLVEPVESLPSQSIDYMVKHYDNEEGTSVYETETESETESGTETETESETETDSMPSLMSENETTEKLVTCDGCGNQWDGYSQCPCPADWYKEDYNNYVEVSMDGETIQEEELPTEHPIGWNSYAHYGMCGQSCPCCRSEHNERLGSCPVCDKQRDKIIE